MRNVLCLIGLVVVPVVVHAEDWQPLFNGKDLTGWRANLDPAAFTVKDCVLRVQASAQTRAHLFYVGDRKEGLEPFKDFELEATVRAEPNANGGIFVHTDMATRDAKMHLANGYEVQLNSSTVEARKTGSLYAVVDLDKSPVDESKWFTVRVVVKGKRITVSLDGKEVVDYTEPADVVRPKERAGRLFREDGGAIALQAHDAGSVWYFKDIRIKRLNDSRDDSKIMQGLWTPAQAELAGQPMPENVLKTIRLKMEDDKYEVLVGKRPDKGTYTIDADAKPKSITITGTEGPNKGKTFPAIYELTEDTLRVCYDLSGAKRPTEFKTIAGTQLYLVTYHRQKK